MYAVKGSSFLSLFLTAEAYNLLCLVTVAGPRRQERGPNVSRRLHERRRQRRFWCNKCISTR